MKEQLSWQKCFVCGQENPHGLKIKFVRNSDEEVMAECCIPVDYQGYPGVVHGGVVAAMLDEVAGRVWWGDERPFVVTARLDVRYRKPTPVGQTLKLVGKAGKRRGNVAEASGMIYGPDGSLLAEAEGVFVEVSAEDVKRAGN
jgi:acyl-coenzyme A thioesterase PaaI-like protein